MGCFVAASIEEYRQNLFEAVEGRQVIYIFSRENIFDEICGVYKDPSFDYKKETLVQFAGENGKIYY